MDQSELQERYEDLVRRLRYEQNSLSPLTMIGGMLPSQIPPPSSVIPTRSLFNKGYSPLTMIAMRLGTPEGQRIGSLPYIDAYVENGKAVVFVINKELKPVVIEDDPNLFPSDTLITQLRVIIG